MLECQTNLRMRLQVATLLAVTASFGVNAQVIPPPGAVQEQIRTQPVLRPTPSDSKLDSRAAIGRANQLLLALLTGDVDAIKDIQLKFHFINVIGIPRNGGSYLTKELYRSMGYDPTRVPNVISHDGFQDAGPFRSVPFR